MKITYNEALKEIRAEARSVGLVFKKQRLTINGQQAWMFQDKESGENVLKNCTVWSAYEKVCSGYVASYDNKTGYFAGINCYK